jgi:hypothetical protein
MTSRVNLSAQACLTFDMRVSVTSFENADPHNHMRIRRAHRGVHKPSFVSTHLIGGTISGSVTEWPAGDLHR